MKNRIEKMDAFRTVGLKLETTNEAMQGMKDIQKFWGEVIQANKQMELLPLMDSQPTGMLGISVYNTDEADSKKFDYYIGCASSLDVPEGMEAYTVPAATWAVFPCTSKDMGEVQVKIINEWLPASGYKALNSGYETGEMKSGAPDIELYGQGEEMEIWVPVEEI